MEDNLKNEIAEVKPKRNVPARRKPTTVAKPQQEYVGDLIDKKSITWQRDRDREMVKGKFINHEQPGTGLSFVNLMYKGDKLQRYDLECGKIHEIPLGVANHLNDNCATPVYEHIQGDKKMLAGLNPDNKGGLRVTRLINRFSFQPLNFTERDRIGTNSNRIIKVESI